jgi:hypothetical protein
MEEQRMQVFSRGYETQDADLKVGATKSGAKHRTALRLPRKAGPTKPRAQAESLCHRAELPFEVQGKKVGATKAARSTEQL